MAITRKNAIHALLLLGLCLSIWAFISTEHQKFLLSAFGFTAGLALIPSHIKTALTHGQK